MTERSGDLGEKHEIALRQSSPFDCSEAHGRSRREAWIADR